MIWEARIRQNGQPRQLPLQEVRAGVGRVHPAGDPLTCRVPRSATVVETVIFEGMYISVGELKRSIVEKKGLSRDHAAELMLSEAETGRGSRAPRCARRAARPMPDEASSNPTFVCVCVPRLPRPRRPLLRTVLQSGTKTAI